MIDFDWYRSFVAVYRAGTVTKAAEARLLTQPAVSLHVAALEAAISRPLFKRTPRRMVPTEHGQELYARIAQAVDTLEVLAQQLLGAGTDEQPLFRLGAPADYFHVVALERLVAAPVRLWARFGETSALLDALGRGELDMVVATQRLPVQGVDFAKLADERFLLVGAADLSPPDAEGTDAETHAAMERWLATQRWISYGVALPIIRRFWQRAFGERPPLQPALVIPDLRAIGRAMELGHGIGLLPDYLCREALLAGRLRILWEPPEPVGNELWIAYRRVDRGDAQVRLVLALLGPRPEPSAGDEP